MNDKPLSNRQSNSYFEYIKPDSTATRANYGTRRVYSIFQCGTSSCFSLPLACRTSTEHAAQNASLQMEGTTPNQRTTKRVLASRQLTNKLPVHARRLATPAEHARLANRFHETSVARLCASAPVLREYEANGSRYIDLLVAWRLGRRGGGRCRRHSYSAW